MPTNIDKRESIRSIKTGKAFGTAIFSLLGKHNFRKITVRDICEEAVISRATFHSLFTDKYVFMKWWMMAIWFVNPVNKNDIYEVKECN